MFIVCLRHSWISYGDSPGMESAITSLTPLASFSLKKDAEQFRKDVDGVFDGHLRFEVVGEGRMPHDPERITWSVKRKVEKYLEAQKRRRRGY